MLPMLLLASVMLGSIVMAILPGSLTTLHKCLLRTVPLHCQAFTSTSKCRGDTRLYAAHECWRVPRGIGYARPEATPTA
jgi:hypothetical protein